MVGDHTQQGNGCDNATSIREHKQPAHRLTIAKHSQGGKEQRGAGGVEVVGVDICIVFVVDRNPLNEPADSLIHGGEIVSYGAIAVSDESAVEE